jgi:Metalloenzyme superfamily
VANRYRAFFALAFVIAYALAESYIGRLSNHAGYYLVSVEDRVAVPAPRPRHAVLVLVDGLTRAGAERLEARKRLAAAGQCRVMEVGPITISRPVYAVLSAGLEEDRTGSRNNDEKSPLAAESVWQVARRSGLRVYATSGLVWWKQLFPDGFSRYDLVGGDDDPFAPTELADMNLVHPLYVDEKGHDSGAASPEYAAAVDRVDRELGRFLDRSDFSEDLVVLTADHGHTSYGGHGGPEPELTHVLTCFAGRGVARRSDVGRMDARSLGPAFALFSGVPFPRNMRAGEDDLDVLFEIADPASFPAAYLDDRRAAVERFRAENTTALAGWLGPRTPPTWAQLYARESRKQTRRLVASAALLALLFAVAAWRRRLGMRGAVVFLL